MCLSVCLFLIGVLGFFLRWRTRRAFRASTVGFLHATSGNGGGGERVLWVAIDQLQRADEAKQIDRDYVLYTNVYEPTDVATGSKRRLDSNVQARNDEALLDLVESQFHIRPKRRVKIVYLRGTLTQWLRAEKYPRLTLLLQTVVGGCALFFESAVANVAAPLMVETVGVPMVYPLLRVLAGATVVSYTHFPIVSSSMLERVRAGTVSTTNKGAVVTNPFLRLSKLAYYQVFTLFYRFLGQFPAVVLTNSSWTQGHIGSLYWPRKTAVLYPPCDVADFASQSKPPSARANTIVSVGQFRPEKNHMLQLHAFHRAIGEGLPDDAKLVMLGGVRDAADRARAASLVAEADRLGITRRVEVVVNAPFSGIVSYLSTGCVGLHTMLDEHFGIVVLEYLAAGIIPLAHNSGGVRLDIVPSRELGFLATTEEDFAQGMIRICQMRAENPRLYRNYQDCAAAHVAKFTDNAFGEQFCRHLSPFLSL